MVKKRALKEVARYPLAKKGSVVLEERREEKNGLGHYALAVAVGLVIGAVGGLLANRFWRIL
jgi:hypothetical protein